MAVTGKRPEYGQRVPKDVRERFEAYVEREIEIKDTDSSETSEKKRRIAEKLEHYSSVVHPIKSVYGVKEKGRKHRYLTMQSLPDYMDAVEIPFKTFFEFCIKQNSGLSGPDDTGWTQISWTTEEQGQMADLLRICSPKEKRTASELILELMPAFYGDFRESLRVDSGENLPLGRPAASRTEADKDIPVLLKENNMGVRMAETVNYMCDESHVSSKQVCQEAGLYFLPKKMYAPRHYWAIYNFEDIWDFCKEFRISPHWAMFGPTPVRVLADSVESEMIMDDFSFLPASLQKQAVSITKKRLGR